MATPVYHQETTICISQTACTHFVTEFISITTTTLTFVQPQVAWYCRRHGFYYVIIDMNIVVYSLLFCVCLIHTHIDTHTRTYARMDARTHAHRHKQPNIHHSINNINPWNQCWKKEFTAKIKKKERRKIPKRVIAYFVLENWAASFNWLRNLK